MENNDFLAVCQNQKAFTIMYSFSYLKDELQKRDSRLVISIPNKEGGAPETLAFSKTSEDCIELAKAHMSPSQVQLLTYLTYLLNKQRSIELKVDVNKYLELQGVSTSDQNYEKFLNDLRLLSYVTFNFKTERRGKGSKWEFKRTPILVVLEESKIVDMETHEVSGRHLVVRLGNWIEYSNQYSLVHKSFFAYNSSAKYESFNVLISIKLRELVRNNLKSGTNTDKVHCISVEKLLDILPFNEGTIKAKGFRIAVKARVEKALGEVALTEGYTWKYRNGEHENFRQYKEDFIEFTDCNIVQKYGNYERKKSK